MPWLLLSVEDVQEAVDLEFGLEMHGVTEKGAWMGLANYRMMDFQHEISMEAEKAVEAFIKEYSETLSSPALISQYMTWLVMPTSPGKGIMAMPPFMWQGWKADGMKRWDMFHHKLIICVMAEAHFMALPGTMDDTSTIPYLKGALLLTAQAVEHAILMWTTGVFVNNSTSAFSCQNYDDITEEYPLSATECVKYGQAVRKKTVKMKCVSVYLTTLESWKEDKWNDLLADIKKAIEMSSSKKKCKTATLAHSTSPDLIEEAMDIVFRSDPPKPNSEESSSSEESANSSGEEDEDEVQEDDQIIGCSGVIANPGEEDSVKSENGMVID